MLAMFASSWRTRRGREPVEAIKLGGSELDASAAMFSSTRSTRRVPGIGAMSSPRVSSQASVLRHSTARQALVRVEAGYRGVLIEVLDEGSPSPAADQAVGQAAGHGLAGMRERAAALGGSCQAGPADGTGWRVRAEIPIAGARV
jgi:signal transduction histidine kinase